MILAGLFSLIFPAFSSFALLRFLGWLLIATGIVQGLGLIGARAVPQFWLQLISVVLFVLVGTLILNNAGAGLLTITLLLIVFFMIEGISKVIFALTIRPLPHWGLVLLSGIIVILLALTLWANMPLTAVWLPGVLFGVGLISEGAALAYLAWRVRSADDIPIESQV
ncbi:hypothetical protein GCM10007276_31610 [Agaricicola taiwanensis]|uniref:HdeD family acid-resistance protein n=1 Tax=Agaricicola taiwanensis TaxID=591372 RepID=A0A8J3DZT9_9RHOB|nr:HdeD family acid-resistance protein [Agaricicola taiwanensis]GGE52284.1 hypothetical protein GCM10007276_31610 [Agaricicola taiwanensis]